MATLRKTLLIGAVDPSILGVYTVMSPGSCRLSSTTDEGTKDTDFTLVSVSTVAECKALCDNKPECEAVEVNPAGWHCELWTKLPMFTSGAANSEKYSCYLKKKGTAGLHMQCLVRWATMHSQMYLSVSLLIDS